MPSPRVLFDLPFVEDAVRQALEALPAGHAWREEHRRFLDRLYEIPVPRRPGVSEALHADFFRRLGWEAIFRHHLDPLLPRLAAAGVRRAGREEGCFVDSAGRLQLLVRPARLADREGLSTWLRHEMGHAADILDPGFGYRHETLDEPTRERYARLWCESIDARLAGRDLEPVTHATLLQRARAQGRPRCPVCEMPAAVWGRPSGAVAEFLRKEIPSWRPEAGVCGHCLEWAELTATTAGRQP